MLCECQILDAHGWLTNYILIAWYLGSDDLFLSGLSNDFSPIRGQAITWNS